MSSERRVFLSWIDENEQTRATYVTLVSVTDNLITFRTKGNIVTIPTSRLLKLKEGLP